MITTEKLSLHPQRLFPTNPVEREIANSLFEEIKDLPIISPHGHTDPSWFANNEHFKDPAELLITPDHYVYRMLYSVGIPLSALGVRGDTANDNITSTDPRKIWKIFAQNYHLFYGTPTRYWLDYVFYHVFGLDKKLNESTADYYYECIDHALAQDEFRPRSILHRFNIEVLSTTDAALSNLNHHEAISKTNISTRVLPTFRPDSLIDPMHKYFYSDIERLQSEYGQEFNTFQDYLEAIIIRRAYFKSRGATATDHGVETAMTCDLSAGECEILFKKVLSKSATNAEKRIFLGQMLTEMAKMSTEDGLVMQLHVGSKRNHNTEIFENYGPDKGADIPQATDLVNGLYPLLNKLGNNKDLTLIIFTLDESSYSREVAPLAGHYPCLKVGPAWWFHDSPNGIQRHKENIIETAGFYNTVGFNDDTRALLSIPARHDLSRRMDCSYLAGLVAKHLLDMSEATKVAKDLTYSLVKSAYKL